MKNPQIIPVLLGADLNCYSVARAFHEAYGATSYALGKINLGTTKYSKFIHFTETQAMDDPEILIPILEQFAKDHAGALLILVGCLDAYADLIIENKERLSKYYFCSAPRADLAKKLISKEAFYQMCEQYGIHYPKTEIMHDLSELEKLSSLPFPYPIVLKPSSSIRYWEHPFDGMKKVYILKTKEEAEEIAKTIFASGYDDSLILQDFIPGDDSGMYVLTAYSDQNAKVKMMCLGHVLLEEHTPKGVGNHVAIVTEYHEEPILKIKAFLETIGYTGFSNFDIKFDPRDQTFRVFEINLRQGRSNYYVTHAGANLANLLVSDARNEMKPGTHFVKTPSFWHTVPKKIIYSYIHDEAVRNHVQTLVKEKKTGTSLFYKKDLRWNPMRLAYVVIHNHRYHKKYKLYP